MHFVDALTLDAPKRTRDGYVAVRARVARTGVYDYAGYEVDPANEHGLRDKAIVKVLRDADTVFDRGAIQSFIGKPVTIGHPAKPVNAANWRDHARGSIMGALRDGQYLAFDLLLTDQSAIQSVEDGKRELSNGYSADLEFGRFEAPDGTICDARQARITGGNHVAIVDRGRAGSTCRIADAQPFALCDAIPAPEEKPVSTITHDGLPVNLNDEAAVRALVAKLQDAATAANGQVTTLTNDLSTANGKVTALEAQLADAKAAAEPAKLDALVADRAALIATAKAVAPAVVTDGKDAATIRREVVAVKLGDKTPADDAAVAGAFAVLAADAKPADKTAPLGQTAVVTDAIATRDAARNAYIDRLNGKGE